MTGYIVPFESSKFKGFKFRALCTRNDCYRMTDLYNTEEEATNAWNSDILQKEINHETYRNNRN